MSVKIASMNLKTSCKNLRLYFGKKLNCFQQDPAMICLDSCHESYIKWHGYAIKYDIVTRMGTAEGYI